MVAITRLVGERAGTRRERYDFASVAASADIGTCGQVLQAVAGVRGASATSGMWAARAGARQAFGVGAGAGGRKRKGVQGMLSLALSKVTGHVSSEAPK
jgi:hypothetical protein